MATTWTKCLGGVEASKSEHQHAYGGIVCSKQWNLMAQMARAGFSKTQETLALCDSSGEWTSACGVKSHVVTGLSEMLP